MSRSFCENDHKNDRVGRKEDDDERTPKRNRVQGSSLRRRVQFFSVATISVFDPENRLVTPMPPPHGVLVNGI